ncbi:TetR/AcrR family transcriptional regulator [Paenibacillus qinlingensis]|uniref:AcrR family transcriptional regulator n=1 Tax=Paenibacillus qinlingensis TaxID=1837343 RepID=A0ABU1P5R9_9BACL|nr:TetR/AcrR family transcriptional regulator [Paenibacillus qinlingensis]MDR6555105.1 AcrR family transcriptional regulator [Paenibacillus qinlingensis]
MKKGEKTKLHIIEQAAILMNRKGFLSTPLSDIVEVTGMQKGGLYNHFKDKEELALLAFDECNRIIHDYIAKELNLKITSKERIVTFIESYLSFGENPTLPGGCPIMNASVEADFGQSEPLMKRTQSAMQSVIDFLSDMIAEGITDKEIRSDVNPKQSAVYIMATVEGAILLSNVFNDRSHIKTVNDQLMNYIDNLFD